MIVESVLMEGCTLYKDYNPSKLNFTAHPCAELVLPENTILACNNWNTDYAVVCKYYCLDGYYYPVGITEHTVLSCGASGTWFPYLLFEGCVPYGIVFANITLTCTF